MSESQLPENYRSRIQQGFAALFLLTSLLFFWILVASNEPPRGGGGLIWGLGGPVAQALGSRPPVAKSVGGRGPAAQPVGGRSPPSPGFEFPRSHFALRTLSPSAWATGPLSPKQLAAGWYFCKIFKPGGIFAI